MKLTELKEALLELQRKYSHNRSLLAFVSKANRILVDKIKSMPAEIILGNTDDEGAACASTAGGSLPAGQPAGWVRQDRVAIAMHPVELPATTSSDAKGQIAIEIDSFLKHTDNFFLRNYYAQVRSEAAELKTKILESKKAKVAYAQQSDEQFFNELAENLIRSLTLYSQNFHLVPIAPDRIKETQDLIYGINKVKAEEIPYARKIGRVLKVLLNADRSIKTTDAEHKPRNVFTSSRLQGIVVQHANRINNYTKSDATKIATAKLREAYAARQLFSELELELNEFINSLHSKQRKEEAKNILERLEIFKASYNNEATENKEKSLLRTLHSLKVNMIKEDQQKWFFKSTGGALRTIIETAVADILNRAKTNHILAAAIKTTLEDFISDLKAQGQNNPKLAKDYAPMIAQYQAVLDMPQPVISDTADTLMVSPSLTPVASPQRNNSKLTTLSSPFNVNHNSTSLPDISIQEAPKLSRHSPGIALTSTPNRQGQRRRSPNALNRNKLSSGLEGKENLPNNQYEMKKGQIKKESKKLFDELGYLPLSTILAKP